MNNPPAPYPARGPSIFITGASSGIGEGFARYYAETGAILGISGRDAPRLAALKEALYALGAQQVACYVLDVRDEKALSRAATAFMRDHGVPEIVIASAGVSVGTLTEYQDDLESIKQVFDTNVYGMAATFSPFIAKMRELSRHDKPYTLVGIASVAGIRGLPGAGAYSASKSAVKTFLESLRLEMRPYHIRVVTIAPGYIETPMTAINEYRMPFLMPIDRAIPAFVKAIHRGKRYTVIPWPMGVVAKILRVLPNVVYDALFVNAPRKARAKALATPKKLDSVQ